MGSRSSHSGSSSTRSTENSASRSQQTLSTEATPHLTPTQHNHLEMNGRKIEPKRSNYTSLIKTEATPTLMLAQSWAFQTIWSLFHLFGLLLYPWITYTTSIMQLFYFPMQHLFSIFTHIHTKNKNPWYFFIFLFWGTSRLGKQNSCWPCKNSYFYFFKILFLFLWLRLARRKGNADTMRINKNSILQFWTNLLFQSIRWNTDIPAEYLRENEMHTYTVVFPVVTSVFHC